MKGVFTGLFLSAVVLALGCTMPEVRMAEQMAAQGDWDGAVAAYRKAIRKEPFDEDLKRRLEECRARAAEIHYGIGRQYLKERRVPEAVHELKMAVGYDPGRGEHHAALADALRLQEARDKYQTGRQLQELGRIDEAIEAYERAVQLDPNLTAALDGITTLAAQQQDAKAFAGSSQPLTLRFQNARMKEVFEILARAGGINVVFDRDVRDDPLTIFIKDMPFQDALNLILSTNNLFSQRISADTILIIPNTKQKKDQYQDLMIRTFYLSNAKAKDMVNLLRTMLESKRVYVNEGINAVVVRETPDKLRLAERILLANDRREAEVEFDLEVLEVNRTKTLQYGLNFAKTAGAGVFPPDPAAGGFTAAQTFTYQQLTSLGSGSFLFTFPASVLMDFFKQESDAKTLANPKLRVVNNEKATINVGDKQPILLSTTNQIPTAPGSIPTTSTITSIEFKDTGVKLTVEPTIHLVNELTLKLKIEVTRLGDEVTLQDTPLVKQFRFGTRTAETVLNMKDGETVVLAGLIQDEERKSRSSVPLLGDIPILGHLFSSTKVDTIQTEVVLAITPRIIRSLKTPGPETQTFWSGTSDNYSTEPMFAPVPVKTEDAVPANVPFKAPQPSGKGPMLQEAVPEESPALSPAPPAGSSSPPAVAPPATPEEGDSPAVVARRRAALAFRPSEISTLVGQDVRLNLSAEQFGAFRTSTVTLAYDPAVLELREAVEGEVLKRASGAASMTVSADPASGRVTLAIRHQGQEATSGVLATLILRAKQSGNSPVTVQQVVVTGSEGQPIPVSSAQAVVRVQ